MLFSLIDWLANLPAPGQKRPPSYGKKVIEMLKAESPVVTKECKREGLPYYQTTLSNGLVLTVASDMQLLCIEEAYILGPTVKLDDIIMAEFTRQERFQIRNIMHDLREAKLAEEHTNKVTRIYATLNQEPDHAN